MRMKSEKRDMYVEMLERCTLMPGAPGKEGGVAELLEKDLAGISQAVKRFPMGNILFRMEHDGAGGAADAVSSTASAASTAPASREQSGLRVLFAAHMDEVAMRVAEITDEGFIRIVETGRWNPLTIASTPVEIITTRGDRIPGIIGSVPPHFAKPGGDNGLLDITEYAVDAGARSAEDAVQGMGISLGDPVVPVTRFYYDEDRGTLFSKALDDRAGVAAMAALGKRLAEEGLGSCSSVLLAGTVQEEVGTRGAQALSSQVPDMDIAVIIEGAPADDIPGIPGKPQTRLGGGAHVRVFDPTMIVHSGLLQYARDIADEYRSEGGSVQEAVRRGGGTDGRALHLAEGGIPAIVTGVPVRYAHSSSCMSSLDDFEDLVEYLVRFVQGISRVSL